MQHLGDIRLGDTIDMKFTTVSTSGVPTQLAGSPAVAAYPGNSTTEVTAGITLTVDFDTRTGLNNVRVVATSGNGYATATDYALVITAGTVSGSSVVGYVVGHFSIEKRSALMPTTAARTVVVDANGRVDVGSVSGTAQTAGDIIGVTNDIQSRLPTSLVMLHREHASGLAEVRRAPLDVDSRRRRCVDRLCPEYRRISDRRNTCVRICRYRLSLQGKRRSQGKD